MKTKTTNTQQIAHETIRVITENKDTYSDIETYNTPVKIVVTDHVSVKVNNEESVNKELDVFLDDKKIGVIHGFSEVDLTGNYLYESLLNLFWDIGFNDWYENNVSKVEIYDINEKVKFINNMLSKFGFNMVFVTNGNATTISVIHVETNDLIHTVTDYSKLSVGLIDYLNLLDYATITGFRFAYRKNNGLRNTLN